MRIIGIYPGHNATVGLFVDGVCRRILHEEKFTNVKNQGGFPDKALREVLRELTGAPPDAVVFPGRLMFLHWAGKPAAGVSMAVEGASQSRMRRLYNWLEYRTGWKWLFTGLRNTLLERVVTPRAREAMLSLLESQYGLERRIVRFVDHHLCHALTPVFFHGLDGESEPLLLMTLDGDGDKACSKIYRFNPTNGKLDLLASSPFDASPGLLYLRMTEFLGMKANEHEYKVMGLAAYVSEEKYYRRAYERLKPLIRVNQETLCFESPFNTNDAHLYYRRWLVGERFDNLAAALQRVTEEVVTEWIRAAVRRTGLRRVCLSGGVFMNVKLNQRIMTMPEIERLHIMPSCGDESLVIGAAAAVSREHGERLTPIRSMYSGVEYEEDALSEKILALGRKWVVRRPDDIDMEIARLLAEFRIVALFRGAGEWGARSLCHRAVLGNASDFATFYEVNDAIKMRDFWMPFAPTILEEWAPRYIAGWDRYADKVGSSTEYMILTFDSTPMARKHLRAAIHPKDHTLRPQIVGGDADPGIRRILKLYEALTGMGGVLNTSLNLHGYPLVGTVEQAMDTFEQSGLRYMAIGPYLVSKPDANSGAERRIGAETHEATRNVQEGCR